jgi:hypothetical protein
MEVRAPSGKCCYYALKASNKRLTRKEAEEMVRKMVHKYEDHRMYREWLKKDLIFICRNYWCGK